MSGWFEWKTSAAKAAQSSCNLASVGLKVDGGVQLGKSMDSGLSSANAEEYRATECVADGAIPPRTALRTQQSPLSRACE